MTDKQIIIDGVDVSGCKKLHWDIAPFLKKEERPFNQHEWKCGGGFAQTYCHNDKNCLYKQLKRKEQECETLASQLDFEVQKKECLEKECEELKKKCNIYTCGICGNKEDCNKLYKTLAEIKEIAENMNNECFYDDFDCKDCDMQNGCTYFNKKQILQKISEVVE